MKKAIKNARDELSKEVLMPEKLKSMKSKK